jgi:3-oxoacyl-[acyl-carrier protein] reductase
MSALPLSGRVALVTGVSRRIGIGAAIARRLLADGALVFASGWTPHDEEMPWGADSVSPEALGAALGATGETFHQWPCDLEDPDAPAALVDACIERFGGIDILVANHARSSHYDLETLTATELDRCWAINARASVLLARELGRRREPTPGGRLVLFTSGQHIGPMADEIPYAVSKGAIQQMTRTLADALADRGVTVNCVNPGPVDTGWANARLHAQVAARFPGGQWGQPEDVARLVAWLVSDEAAWISGTVLDSEGGFRRWR